MKADCGGGEWQRSIVARRYTVDEVLAFPNDGNRYGLVDGELLVTPAPLPRYQMVVSDLTVRMDPYLKKYPGIARLFIDITWDREKLVQPDLFVVPASEVSNRWTSFRTLLLAVEVVSPSSARGDRLTKRRLQPASASRRSISSWRVSRSE